MNLLALLQQIRPLLAAVSAVAAAAAVYWLLSALGKPGASRALDDFTHADTGRAPDAYRDMGTRAYKVRLAFSALGVDVPAGKENLYYWAAVVLLSAVSMGLAAVENMPLMVVLGMPVLVVGLFNGWVDGRWEKQRQAIEAEIPVFLTRLSSMMQVNSNLLQALDDVTASLSPGPLQAWMRRLAQSLQAHGEAAFTPALTEAEAISPSLHVVVMSLSRMWSTGGMGYVEAFRMSAENLVILLNSRAEASAVASKAWSTIRVILLALGGAFVVVFAQPSNAKMMHSTTVQIGLFFLILWGVIGYWYIRGQIAEVLA